MGKKKTEELGTGHITITPTFDGFDDAVDTLADKIEKRIAQAVSDGITAGIRKALPAPRPTAMRDGR